MQRLQDNRNYYGSIKRGVGGSLNLFGWRLDEFYEQMADEVIEFEDKDGKGKKKGTLTRAEENPQVTMEISERRTQGDNVFHGITVKGTIPEVYQGTDAAYYIGGGHLCRVEETFLQKIEPFVNLARGNYFSFHVGRNHLSEFYYRILPQFQDEVDITEKNPERIRAYLLPDVRFLFYLDAPQDNITCRIRASYGVKNFNALESLNEDGGNLYASFRDGSREQEVVFQVMQWLTNIDWEKEELHCGGDEELVYQMMKDGAFLDMDDSALGMLAEMVDAMHLKPKEFIKGKVHLPMYRTLYLDKMLEENEAVYSARDSHFKKVVKGFKTVRDADFEEPKSLSKIMRKYQKDGYKWLRTLESWQFGGILADDMGLGKTLQVIAVLLAAKAVKVVKSKIRYALTGTPIENRLSELWSIFDYLMPGFLYGYDVFKREIETPIVKNQDEAAMACLQKMVGPFILRRLKEDVLKDLPEKLEESRYVRLGAKQRELYDGQVVHMKESIAKRDKSEFNKDKMLILAELTRLRQICCDPSLCFEDYKGETGQLRSLSWEELMELLEV